MVPTGTSSVADYPRIMEEPLVMSINFGRYPEDQEAMRRYIRDHPGLTNTYILLTAVRCLLSNEPTSIAINHNPKRRKK